MPAITQIEEEYCKAFSTAETHLKNAEIFIKSEAIHGVVISAINELRYAGYHVAQALNPNSNLTEAEKIKLYEEAIAHCRRSSFDSLDALFQFAIAQCTIFCKDYRLITISEIIPDYLADCQHLEEIKKELKPQDNKELRWANMEKHLGEVFHICEKWNIAREELNKILKKTQNEHWHKTVEMTYWILAAIVACITIISFFKIF
jgi:hypothetical protein